jgi:hypothetical protein
MKLMTIYHFKITENYGSTIQFSNEKSKRQKRLGTLRFITKSHCDRITAIRYARKTF